MFIFTKSPYALSKLRVRKVSVEKLDEHTPEEQVHVYWKIIHERSRQTFAKWYPTSLLAMLEWEHFRPCPFLLVESLKNDFITSQSLTAFGHLRHRPQGLRRFANRKIGSRLKSISCPDLNLPKDVADFIKESIELETEHGDSTTCPCCGLYFDEVRVLKNIHDDCVRRLCPVLVNSDREMTPRQRIIIYCSSRKQATFLAKAHKVFNKNDWIRCLTSSTANKTRHNILQDFCSKDRDVINLYFFIRGLRSGQSMVERNLGNLEMSIFYNLVTVFLVPVKYLFIDGVLGMNFNEHWRTTSIILPTMPSHPQQLVQMCDKFTRIDCGVNPEKKLQIKLLSKRYSLDDMFYAHLFCDTPKFRQYRSFFAGLDYCTYDELGDILLASISPDATLAKKFAVELIETRRPIRPVNNF